MDAIYESMSFTMPADNVTQRYLFGDADFSATHPEFNALSAQDRRHLLSEVWDRGYLACISARYVNSSGSYTAYNPPAYGPDPTDPDQEALVAISTIIWTGGTLVDGADRHCYIVANNTGTYWGSWFDYRVYHSVGTGVGTLRGHVTFRRLIRPQDWMRPVTQSIWRKS